MRKLFSIPSGKCLTRHTWRSNLTWKSAFLGGFLLTISAVLVRMLSGPPYGVYIMVRQIHSLPPLILLLSLHLLLIFGMGAAVGIIMIDYRPYVYAAKYRAGMFFVIQITVYLAVYPLIFQSVMPRMALLFLILSFMLSLLCLKQFFEIRPLCGCIALIFSAWQFYMILLLLGCLLRI